MRAVRLEFKFGKISSSWKEKHRLGNILYGMHGKILFSKEDMKENEKKIEFSSFVYIVCKYTFSNYWKHVE